MATKIPPKVQQRPAPMPMPPMPSGIKLTPQQQQQLQSQHQQQQLQSPYGKAPPPMQDPRMGPMPTPQVFPKQPMLGGATQPTMPQPGLGATTASGGPGVGVLDKSQQQFTPMQQQFMLPGSMGPEAPIKQPQVLPLQNNTMLGAAPGAATNPMLGANPAGAVGATGFNAKTMRRGGAIKMASGGSVSKASTASRRGDGIAQRGKTKGRYL